MSETPKHITLFDGSGCLTLPAFRALEAGDLDKLQYKEANKHLAECELCTETLAAMPAMPSDVEILAGVTAINQAVAGKVAGAQGGGTPSSGSSKYAWMGAAASVVLILSFGLFFALKSEDAELKKLYTENYETFPAPDPLDEMNDGMAIPKEENKDLETVGNNPQSLKKENQNNLKSAVTEKEEVIDGLDAVQEDAVVTNESPVENVPLEDEEELESDLNLGFSSPSEKNEISELKTDVVTDKKSADNTVDLPEDDFDVQSNSTGATTLNNNINPSVSQDNSYSNTSLEGFADSIELAFDESIEDVAVEEQDPVNIMSKNAREERKAKSPKWNSKSRSSSKSVNSGVFYDSNGSQWLNTSAALDEGMNAYRLKKYADAVATFEKVLLQEPNQPEARFYAAVSYLEIDRPTKAFYHLDFILNQQSHKYREPAKWYQSLALVKLNRKSEAKKLLNEIVKEGGFYKDQAGKLLLELED